MKKKTNDKIVPNLLKGLTGILFAVSTFILPGLLYAEEPGHVMPQEQVFLDPSQVEAAQPVNPARGRKTWRSCPETG